LSVALHAGVGSPSAPAAKNIVTVSAVPLTVPVTLPLLLRWHELHDPSLGFVAVVRTVPDTAAPLWVSCQATTVGPCESLAVPDQLPVRSMAAGAEGDSDGGATGVGLAGDPQLYAATAERTLTSRSTFMRTPRPASPLRCIRV